MKDKEMQKHSSIRNVFFILVALLLAAYMPGKNYCKYSPASDVKLMFYNVENLFDTIDGPNDDSEFLPNSFRRWNTWKYYRKLDRIRKVIFMAGEWSPPAIVGLCEVENEKVVNDLVYQLNKSDCRYKYSYARSTDKRGIGVALLYSDRFNKINQEILYPVNKDGDTLNTRSVLYMELADNRDTLKMMVTHWPSRRGGVAATDRLRADVACLMRLKLDEINRQSHGRSNIIIMGDFNCDPGEYPVSLLINKEKECTGSNNMMNLPGEEKKKALPGTYKYHGIWHNYDQIIISSHLYKGLSAYVYIKDSYSIVGDGKMMADDKAYRGKKPYSTWIGPVYKGGFSDHLPVLIELGQND